MSLLLDCCYLNHIFYWPILYHCGWFKHIVVTSPLYCDQRSTQAVRSLRWNYKQNGFKRQIPGGWITNSLRVETLFRIDTFLKQNKNSTISNLFSSWNLITYLKWLQYDNDKLNWWSNWKSVLIKVVIKNEHNSEATVLTVNYFFKCMNIKILKKYIFHYKLWYYIIIYYII